MLRITRKANGEVVFKVSGQLTAENVAEIETLMSLALPAFLQSYVANLVAAGVRLVPLGQTDGQLAIAALEEAVFVASARARNATTDDLGSAAFMVDLASMAHETQYTRLFRS
jgi:urease accessory protein